ncbi:glucose PTS transporter transcription antiterminator GlcT [Bacillus kwashiorkori]|uniref:glucose PTS transporter transcription antiterminator GlcT n=1 Tax=Bacillus kwashiorkori TaxID=1522318 RepID=UPI000784D5C4|nr:transcription antiterminator [Bacillus kwashiorkori]
MENYVVKKVLNNNVLLAEHESDGEVVLIGKGIGFTAKNGQKLPSHIAEKIFVLKDKEEQEQYRKLLSRKNDVLFDAIIDAMEYIRTKTNSFLDGHFHVALTDHIIFSVHRFTHGMEIKNPFLLETKILYPFEYELAKEVLQIVNKAIKLELPEDEIGFVALHIHSAMNNKKLTDVNMHSTLISELIFIIENEFNIEIDKSDIDYMRLVRHLRFTIERVLKNEQVAEQKNLASLLQKEYPICYNLSWKLIKIMQNTLKKPVYNAEAIYLTMHLQRLRNRGNK